MQKYDQTAERTGLTTQMVVEAAATLERYRQNKAAFDQRVIANEKWYRLRHNLEQAAEDQDATSGWLFNSLLNKHGDMMDNAPAPAVLPRDEGDRTQAQVLSQILPAMLQRTQFEALYDRACYTKLQHGTAIYGVFWDPRAEDCMGDVRVTVVDPLCLYWEAGVRDLQDSRNVFYITEMEHDVLDAMYPEHAGKLRSAFHPLKYLSTYAQESGTKATVVDWYYKRMQPDGNQVVHYCRFVGTTLLYASENDANLQNRGFYDHGKYPFVMDVLFPMEGSPAGFGYVDVMKAPQSYIDRLDRVILRNAELCGKPRWFMRDACAVNEEEFADFSRDFVHVAGRLESDDLRQIEVKPLSAFISNHRLSKIEELKETSGNRDFAQGTTSGGVTAASAILALQEAGNKLSRDCIKGSYRAFREICCLMIALIRQFYMEKRTFRVSDGAGGWTFLPYENMEGSGPKHPNFDIDVRAQKSSPFSQLSVNENAKELYKLGFFKNELADQALMALSMMEFEGIEAVRQQIQQRAQMAQQMSQKLQQAALQSAQNESKNSVLKQQEDKR